MANKMKTKSDFDTLADFYEYRAGQKDKLVKSLIAERDDYVQKAKNERLFTPEIRKEAKEKAAMLGSINRNLGYIPAEVFDGCIGKDILPLIPAEIVAMVRREEKKESKPEPAPEPAKKGK